MRERFAAFAPTNRISGYESFYLVGIGGASMSALAQLLKSRGKSVRGSDSTRSAVTGALMDSGVDVAIGHLNADPREDEALVFTDAVRLDASPEAKIAQERGQPIFRRSQLLGSILRGRKTIAVTGTHGKTTTAGMIANGLIAAGLDPLVLLGADAPGLPRGLREGDGEWAVVEACEAYESYEHIPADVVVVTNVDLDHVDHHGDLEGLKSSLRNYLQSLPDGAVVIVGDDAAMGLAEQAGIEAQSYAAEDWRGPNLAIAGAHAREDAAGALLACLAAGADEERAKEGISTFRGATRRLQIVRDDEIAVVDDYAHHPTEIRATIAALRERFGDRRLVIAFQPHLYSRTASLLDTFAKELSAADLLFITDIYPAREPPMPGVSSYLIYERLTTLAHYVPSRRLLPRLVEREAEPGDVIVGMGAGNISEFVPALLRELERGSKPRVAVVLGGDSAEREVSLHSGAEVVESLERLGYDAFSLDIHDTLFGSGDASELTASNRPDIAFIATHGHRAEDGALQGLLESLHLPYTGSGIRASATAMDKWACRQIAEEQGIDVPEGRLVPRGEWCDMEPPLVVKPNSQGSTVGLTFVTEPNQLARALELAWEHGDALVERTIAGTEITVPVLGSRTLPVVEIVPASGRYDFASKYEPGATDEICPGRISEENAERAAEIALSLHNALGCHGCTRTDMILADDAIYFLEINTLPGLTKTSLVPRSAKAAGMSFDELVEWILKDALSRAGRAKA